MGSRLLKLLPLLLLFGCMEEPVKDWLVIHEGHYRPSYLTYGYNEIWEFGPDLKVQTSEGEKDVWFIIHAVWRNQDCSLQYYLPKVYGGWIQITNTPNVLRLTNSNQSYIFEHIDGQRVYMQIPTNPQYNDMLTRTEDDPTPSCRETLPKIWNHAEQVEKILR